MSQNGRIPPSNVDAEESLLGAALLSASAVDVLAASTKPNEFYKPTHVYIADAIRTLHDKRAPVDVVTVASELQRAGHLEEVGGIAFLNQLQTATPATSAAQYYATAVHDAAELRRLIHLGSDITALGYASDIATAAAQLQTILAELSSPSTTEIDASWTPVDLGPVLDGTRRQPMPTVLRRADEEYLLYAAAVNGIHGDSGAGKGWAVCFVLDQELRAGRTVVLLDFEDSADSIVGRLTALGTSPEGILDRLIYIRPQTEFGTTEVAHVVAQCVNRLASLVVIDSLGEAFALEGIDENKDVEVGPWYRRVARRIAETGAAVLLIDHSTKAADNPLYPSGSKRKRAAVTGASYLAEATKPFVKGEGGRLRLTCAKDRHGNYRRGEVVGNLVMAKSLTDVVRLELHEPDTTEGAAELGAVLAARSAVAAAKAEGRPLTKTALRNLMGIRARMDVKRAGIDLAIGRGALREDPGARNARLVSYVCELPEATAP